MWWCTQNFEVHVQCVYMYIINWYYFFSTGHGEGVKLEPKWYLPLHNLRFHPPEAESEWYTITPIMCDAFIIYIYVLILFSRSFFLLQLFVLYQWLVIRSWVLLSHVLLNSKHSWTESSRRRGVALWIKMLHL